MKQSRDSYKTVSGSERTEESWDWEERSDALLSSPTRELKHKLTMFRVVSQQWSYRILIKTHGFSPIRRFWKVRFIFQAIRFETCSSFIHSFHSVGSVLWCKVSASRYYNFSYLCLRSMVGYVFMSKYGSLVKWRLLGNVEILTKLVI